MQVKTFSTPRGKLTYWVNKFQPERTTLVFLPGVAADARQYLLEIDYFYEKYNLFVWDPPAHGKSRPFSLDFTLMECAEWLECILCMEKAENIVLIGASMGGCLAQCYIERYPERASGFVSINSVPLKEGNFTSREIWVLKNIEKILKIFSWGRLLKKVPDNSSLTVLAQAGMLEMMLSYEKEYYINLIGHTFRNLLGAIDAGLPYKITCPALLIRGDHNYFKAIDRCNQTWSKETGIKLETLIDAGHQANSDQPEETQMLIDEFLESNGLNTL
ncbi:MAG: alpha/beta hydrolase [Bacteroidales bacterium]|nr:alpha/beta hydrolase [Bacteroidales bacterium]MDE7127118.1 alpha/beta hydrolase [Bacteroidales bacterium]